MISASEAISSEPAASSPATVRAGQWLVKKSTFTLPEAQKHHGKKHADATAAATLVSSTSPGTGIEKSLRPTMETTISTRMQRKIRPPASAISLAIVSRRRPKASLGHAPGALASNSCAILDRPQRTYLLISALASSSIFFPSAPLALTSLTHSISTESVALTQRVYSSLARRTLRPPPAVPRGE